MNGEIPNTKHLYFNCAGKSHIHGSSYFDVFSIPSSHMEFACKQKNAILYWPSVNEKGRYPNTPKNLFQISAPVHQHVANGAAPRLFSYILKPLVITKTFFGGESNFINHLLFLSSTVFQQYGQIHQIFRGVGGLVAV